MTTQVLHVVDSLDLGGAERMAVELASLTDPEEFAVSLCATRAGGPLAAALSDDVPLDVLGRRRRWDAGGVLRFRRIVRDRRIDIVHTHGRGSAQFVALCRAGGLRVRHVFHDHFGGVDVDAHAGAGLRLACRWGVDAYIGVHRTLCDRAVETLGLPASRVHLVPNGVMVGRFTPATPADENQNLRLVAVAGFRPDKDHGTLLRAVAQCRAPVELLLVGATAPAHAGYLADCRALVDHLGLAQRVTFAGGRDDVPVVLAGADAGVLSSRTESGPLALLEYMAAGLPFVVTDTGEVTARVKESGAGLVVPVGDPTAMAAALDRLAGMAPAERAAMGARGRARVEAEFDQWVVARRVADVYRSMLAAPAPAGRARSC